ncbi:MAG: hypothetical protein MJZ83_08885 [Bacteroidaceae bacterium]|nr:hypothetical protein [Bacteroidaceae bacterium]
MKHLKSFLILALLLLTGQSKAQEAVIEDVSFLVQYIKGDTEGTRYSVALSKSFTQSEHGRELLKRVHDYSELAMNHMARKNTVNGLEQAKESAYAEIFEVYEKNLAANKQFLAEGHITKEEFEKRKAQNEERRAALEKQMQEQLKDTKELLGGMLNNIPDTPMPDDTEALLNELYRYAVGGKAYKFIVNMGKGLLNVSDELSGTASWGIINLLDNKLFEEKYYASPSYSGKHELFVLKNAQGQYGLFHYNGTPVIAFQKHELVIEHSMDCLVQYNVNNGSQTVLDLQGNPRFTYQTLRAVDGRYWDAKNSNNRWGAVDKDNNVLIPFKYNYIFGVVERETHREFIAGELDTHDELYDFETLEHVANRVNRKIIYLTK